MLVVGPILLQIQFSFQRTHIFEYFSHSYGYYMLFYLYDKNQQNCEITFALINLILA